MHFSETLRKFEKNVLVFEVIAFEFVAGNSRYCEENTCHWKSVC